MDMSNQRADSAGIAEMYKEWAYGAFNLWAEITSGERQDADFERLRKLANPD
ncbi:MULTISPECIES: hypothetical protein [Brenneria]|uniref:hypothetical protein n=1 Tax=Brenneria TaxID=71655 RepID=UPI00030C74FD|nr:MULTISPECIES: hypothetical protein [Brenneria]